MSDFHIIEKKPRKTSAVYRLSGRGANKSKLVFGVAVRRHRKLVTMELVEVRDWRNPDNFDTEGVYTGRFVTNIAIDFDTETGKPCSKQVSWDIAAHELARFRVVLKEAS